MSETVLDGAVVPIDPNDTRVFAFDWDERNLDAGVTIASSAFEVIGIDPAPKAIASITRSSTTATVTTSAAHGLSTGASVTITGCAQADYNITATVTVTGATTFTYTVANSPTTPATAATGGSITYSQGLGKDSPSILSTAGYDSRFTQIRLIAAGPTHLGKRYEIANKITTSESPSQVKERSFFAVIENL